MSSRKATPEGQILRSILDYLAVRKVWAMRMNTGSIVSTYKGKTRMMKFGRPGCADILAMPRTVVGEIGALDPRPVWIEVKAPKGVQSDLQKDFQAEVEAEGHRYIVARSIDDVAAVLV